MIKALTIAIMVWAVCAYGMYTYRAAKLEKFEPRDHHSAN